jgi:hypothetical protein
MRNRDTKFALNSQCEIERGRSFPTRQLTRVSPAEAEMLSQRFGGQGYAFQLRHAVMFAHGEQKDKSNVRYARADSSDV